MRGQSLPVSGRLARRRRVIRPNPTIPIPGPHLRPGNRVPHKRGEIGLGPDPVPVLHRLQPGPSQGSGVSVRRPHRPAPSSDRTGHERRIVHSPSVEIPVRTSGEHDLSGPKSQTTHPPAEEFFFQNQWSQDMPDTTRIRLTQSARVQLEWWLDPTNLTLGVPFSTPDPALTIVTDASSYGWGGHLGDQTASGVWPDQWKSKHINWLELQAVWLTLKHFQDQVRNQVVEVLSDNSTTVSYINRQGGTRDVSDVNQHVMFFNFSSGVSFQYSLGQEYFYWLKPV